MERLEDATMKTISEVASRFNDLAKSTSFSKFYEFRARIHNKKLQNHEFISVLSKNKNEFRGFGFHWGGLQELQFNLGFEEGRFFRYGVAISLQPTRTLTDPVETLSPRIAALNKAIAAEPKIFAGLRMWCHFGDEIVNTPVGPIPPEWVKRDAFIFIGERVNVFPKGVEERNLLRALDVMKALLHVYEMVESDASNLNVKKVARICWNSKMWRRPSGPNGKTKNKDTYEFQNGFGHEEWLLDTSKTIGGWKYGFL
jgi:hypothetical protein